MAVQKRRDAVADPGFPRWGGGNPWVWTENLLFGKIFAENCMKMKEIGPRAGALVPSVPFDPPMWCNTFKSQSVQYGVGAPSRGCSGGSRISPRRGRQLPRGAPTYDFAKFFRKLHEIERIRTPGGGGRASLAPPLDPPLGWHPFLWEILDLPPVFLLPMK